MIAGGYRVNPLESAYVQVAAVDTESRSSREADSARVFCAEENRLRFASRTCKVNLLGIVGAVFPDNGATGFERP